MAKIHNNRPTDWDNQSEDGVNTQSSVSEYKSGKVQKNVASPDAITQEELTYNSKKN